MQNGGIIIPKLETLVVDRTDFKDGRVVFFLWLEKIPVWTSGIIPGCIFDIRDIKGWIAFEHPPQKVGCVQAHTGLFYLQREKAIARAELIINRHASKLLGRPI